MIGFTIVSQHADYRTKDLIGRIKTFKRRKKGSQLIWKISNNTGDALYWLSWIRKDWILSAKINGGKLSDINRTNYLSMLKQYI